jgi:hypothetical protein
MGGVPAGQAAQARVAGSRRGLVVTLIIALVVVAGALAVFILPGLGADDDAPTAPGKATESQVAPQDLVGKSVVPAPSGLTGVAEGSDAVFTWENPAPEAGDSFRWWTVDRFGQVGETNATAATRITTPLLDDDQTCVEVVLVRADGRSSASPARTCLTEGREGS